MHIYHYYWALLTNGHSSNIFCSGKFICLFFKWARMKFYWLFSLKWVIFILYIYVFPSEIFFLTRKYYNIIVGFLIIVFERTCILYFYDLLLCFVGCSVVFFKTILNITYFKVNPSTSSVSSSAQSHNYRSSKGSVARKDKGKYLAAASAASSAGQQQQTSEVGDSDFDYYGDEATSNANYADVVLRLFLLLCWDLKEGSK